LLTVLLAACAATTPASVPSPGAQTSGRRQTVAIFPFDNQAITGRERLDFLSEWLADSLGARLAASGELRIVERRELIKILEEQKLGASELASKEGRLRLGKIVGAQTMLFGGFTAIGDTLQITSRLVDAESGMVVKSASVKGAPAEARRLGEELGDRLVDDLGLTVARRTQEAGLTDNHALEAAENYYAGLALEKNGKKDEAIERFRRALELNHDDDEVRAHLRKLLGAAP
jgi:TolB-like protein